MRTASFLAMILVSTALVAKGQQAVDYLEEEELDDQFDSVNTTGNLNCIKTILT